MLLTAVMQKRTPSVVDAFGHAGKRGTSPLSVHLLSVPHEVLLVELAALVSRLDDTTALFQNHEGTSCKDQCKSKNYNCAQSSLFKLQ
jgi:hypothetical protein